MIAATLAAAAATLLSAAAVPAGSLPATSTDPIVNGPVVPGVCLLSPEVLLTQSKVGQAVNLHLQQLAQQLQGQLQPERTAMETEAKTLDTESRTLSASQLQSRRDALAIHVKTLQDQVSQRNRQLEYTRVKVIQQISQTAQPIIAAAYSSHKCGLLLHRDGVLGGNPTNDLTVEVLHGLDAKLTTIDFNLETPPAATAKPAP